MRRPLAHPLIPLLATLLVACEDSDATGPVPGPVFTQAMKADVEALIGGSMAGWWRAAHGFVPGAALSTAADAHTSSWRNWGMLDAGVEPRQPLVADPGYRYNLNVEPWTELHRTLASVRDGMLALDEGLELGNGGEDTPRARAFGKLMQGLALGTLAQLFPEAFIFDETVDPADVALSPYGDVMEAAIEKLGEAIAIAESNSFTVPAEWAGFARPLSQDDLARLARSWRARLRMSVARDASERAGVDWSAVLADASAGITDDWGGYYDGDYETNWAWSGLKLWAGAHPAWARLDYRTIGPADASGAWIEWINSGPADRRPFIIDTDDRRVTGDTPTADGLYTSFEEDIIFRPERGFDHFSFYADTRFLGLLEGYGVGSHIDFPVAELDFIRAEALYRLGDLDEAMAIVNEWRAHGGLPPFTEASGAAPGPDRCVPRLPDGSCGDLWEALKYEKRIELFHYGPFTEYLDDRGWGDLVEGTFTELPVPGTTLPALLQELYDAGSADAAAALANGVTAESLRAKREAIERFDRAQNGNPGEVGAG